jgi:hypothetical protein
MTSDFDKILDECVDRINRGERLEDCMASYPEHAEELEPLLRSMLDTQTAYMFTPSPTAKRKARQRFNDARAELVHKRAERPTFFPWLFGKSKVWATVPAVLLVALIGFIGLRPVLFPAELVPQPSPEGNFVFLISDEVNAIEDFQSLDISISKVGLQMEGETGQWIELNPEVKAVDLTLLPGDKAREIWRGDIPEGRYSKVFIHISDVDGVLKETGVSANVKLPSEKLQMSNPFEITSDSVANFVYDVTVIQAGQSGMYILKPQIDQSGADQIFERTE